MRSGGRSGGEALFAMNEERRMFWRDCLVAYGCVALWIGLSATVILYNKWVLSYFGFPYPVSLTMMHMAFSSILAFLMVRVFKWVPSADMSFETYTRTIVPIAALFAGTLWMGNAAYLYLSVSFIQMLKALMPVAVFLVGVAFGTEQFKQSTLLNMVVVAIGVAIASFGELNFHILGFLLQMGSVTTESSRLVLVQILLQSKGLKLNPITTLYYIAPACFLCLSLPFALIEMPKIMSDPNVKFDGTVFVTNAGAAFALNLGVFLLIGKTSALTMNIAGVVKDWLLIALSYSLYKAPVTALNLTGYFLAFLAVCYYNYRKLQDKMEADRVLQAAAVAATAAEADPEKARLLGGGGS